MFALRLLPALMIVAAVLGLPTFAAAAPADSVKQDGAKQDAAKQDVFASTVRPLMMKYCGDCHHPEDDANHFRFLDAKSPDDVARMRGLWRNAIMQLENRTMPPADEAQPSEQERLQVISWVDQFLRKSALDSPPYAGQVTIRRLNRREYDNTVRDLLGPEMDFSNTFPKDGSGGEGFDNNGETLFLPPILMERYLEASQKIVDAVVIVPPLKRTFEPADFFARSSRDKNDDAKEKNTSQTDLLIQVFTASEYRLQLRLKSDSQPEAVALLVDDLVAGQFSETDAEKKDGRVVKLRLEPGWHVFTLEADQPFSVDSLRIEQVGKGPSDKQKKFHARLFKPAEQLEKPRSREAAEVLLQDFLPRAFRRPVTPEEVQAFLSLYDRAAERGEPFEAAVKLAVQGVLVSPHFLFRVEEAPASQQIESISAHELAVRLSYFLWSSMPDDELFAAARSGKLLEDDELSRQLTRMLKDPKADQFFEEFTGQWLGTSEVGRLVAPSTTTFKGEFTSDLLVDMRREPVEMVRYLTLEDRSLLELISADYSFINHRLAKHYGIDDFEGKPFRKYEYTDGRRGGLLGMGGVHLLTSYPNRTSPVLRGGWVLETLLGTRVPAPPADVPELKKPKKGEKLTLRQQLEKHREQASCAACHNLIDPVGFGLEHFDVLGRWREKEDGVEVNASGVMADGTEFTGLSELKQILAGRQDDFARTVAAKMLGYALGRSLTDEDQGTVERLAIDLAQQDFSPQFLIRAVAKSPQFRGRQAIDVVRQVASH